VLVLLLLLLLLLLLMPKSKIQNPKSEIRT